MLPACINAGRWPGTHSPRACRRRAHHKTDRHDPPANDRGRPLVAVDSASISGGPTGERAVGRRAPFTAPPTNEELRVGRRDRLSRRDQRIFSLQIHRSSSPATTSGFTPGRAEQGRRRGHPRRLGHDKLDEVVAEPLRRGPLPLDVIRSVRPCAEREGDLRAPGPALHRQYAGEMGKEITKVSAYTIDLFEQLRFSRQHSPAENLIERSVALSSTDILFADSLAMSIHKRRWIEVSATGASMLTRSQTAWPGRHPGRSSAPTSSRPGEHQRNKQSRGPARHQLPLAWLPVDRLGRSQFPRGVTGSLTISGRELSIGAEMGSD